MLIKYVGKEMKHVIIVNVSLGGSFAYPKDKFLC